MTVLKVKINCHCAVCGQDYIRHRNRGHMTICTPCQKKARVKAWKIKNPERKAALNKKWIELNQEKNRIMKCDWQKNNPAIGAAKTKRYLTRKKNAYAQWANEFFIKEIYHLAELRSKAFGFKWHVDHIIPLNGRNVCGLHVENNLQVIPWIDNIIKSNRYEGNS